MLTTAILLSLVETYLTFDFPIPFGQERPEVAFQAKRLSKYYDLTSRTWRDSEASLKQTHNLMLSFCREVYPERDVVTLHQGSLKTLQFCRVKDSTKCADFDTMTWFCVSRDELHTDSHTASPASTASAQVKRCLNESILIVRYETCTPIETTAISACAENTTLTKMDNVQTCNITLDGRETSGLLSADLRCCAKEQTTDTTDPIRIPIHGHNPFIPWTSKPSHRTDSPADPDLPPEWCGLDEVEAQRNNITEAKMTIMKDIYKTQNENSTGKIDYDELVKKIEQVERDLNLEVVELYQEHFLCLSRRVEDTIQGTILLLDNISSDKARESFQKEIRVVNSSLSDVKEKFRQICSDFTEGQSNDFNMDYREVVKDMQVLLLNIERVNLSVSGWEESNCAHCPTTKQSDTDLYTPPPIVPPRPTEEEEEEKEEEEEDNSKLKNQKYLIAIVSAVSVITIIVALVFFIVVVRRTLRKDVSGPFTTLPSADILTNEQYVAFLQKNGYANPTCLLSQKYIDDQD